MLTEDKPVQKKNEKNKNIITSFHFLCNRFNQIFIYRLIALWSLLAPAVC